MGWSRVCLIKSFVNFYFFPHPNNFCGSSDRKPERGVARFALSQFPPHQFGPVQVPAAAGRPPQAGILVLRAGGAETPPGMIWDSSRQENSGIPVVSFNSLGIVSPPFSKSPGARLDLTLEEGRLWRVKEFGITLERGATSSLFVTFRHLLSPFVTPSSARAGLGLSRLRGRRPWSFSSIPGTENAWKTPGKRLGNALSRLCSPSSARRERLSPSPSDNPRATAVGRDVLADF